MRCCGCDPLPVRQDLIRIVDHDPSWASDFDVQRRRLEPVLAPWLTVSIEHIGSTAVQGLPAKPIIDMLAVITDRDAFGDAIDIVDELGWVHAPEPTDEANRKWSLCFPSIAHRTHHLHVVEQGSPDWPQWIAFRDHLRRAPDVAAEYARIKTQLAEDDARDRVRYRAGKAPFIEHVLRTLGTTDSPPG